MNLKPRHNYVVLQLPAKSPAEEKTKGGIIMPSGAGIPGPARQAVAVIKSVGPECQELKPKMKVMYPVHAGLKHTEAAVDYVLLLEHEVIGIVEE